MTSIDKIVPGFVSRIKYMKLLKLQLHVTEAERSQHALGFQVASLWTN